MAVGASNFRPSENEELDSKYTRLHITPLNPTLLPSILPPAVLAASRNISYHSLQTFPEKEFGFVDLPSMEAQKIKKKLNGSILKGTKVKIEEARPSKQEARNEATSIIPEANAKKQEIPSKKRKRDTETLPGIELRDRKVKRGWTDPVAVKKLGKKTKGKKDVVKSKYTSGPELLFRTTLPANKAASTEDAPGLKTERKKKRKPAKEVVVHEFSKTTKHASFLRSSTVPSTAKEVAEYVEGKGWVDASGDVVEAPVKKPKKAARPIPENLPSSSESFVSGGFEEESDAGGSTMETRKEPTNVAKQASEEVSSTSSSGTSSDEEDQENQDSNNASSNSESEGETSQIDEETHDEHPLPSPRTPISLKLDIPKTEPPKKPDSAMHPLEALFKRRQPNLNAPKIPEAVPSFSFFGADGDDDGDDDEEKGVLDSIPMTPYTKQDFALRGLRSAAPTPDTAFPGKSYTVWPTDNVSKEDSAGTDGGATPTQKHKAKESHLLKDSVDAPVSDFQKWFYEHRGENNRAWKRRRKLAAKEKRHRENKKRNERNM
jgi:hypothetical protein